MPIEIAYGILLRNRRRRNKNAILPSRWEGQNSAQLSDNRGVLSTIFHRYSSRSTARGDKTMFIPGRNYSPCAVGCMHGISMLWGKRGAGRSTETPCPTAVCAGSGACGQRRGDCMDWGTGRRTRSACGMRALDPLPLAEMPLEKLPGAAAGWIISAMRDPVIG